MLKRTSDDTPLTLIGILVGVEIQSADVNIEYLMNKMTDAMTCIEGVGTVETEFLGEMDVDGEDVIPPSQGSV